MDKLICNVCDTNEAVGVACSPLGPMSLAYCRECLQNNADAEIMFASVAFTCGEDVNDYVKSMSTYKDGRYMPWREWLATDTAREAIEDGKKEWMDTP